MNGQPKVTLILPSLNVKQYIGKCLASVCRQTLCEIEIICVDACSTDGTWEYLQQAACEDGRIRLFKSKQRSYGAQVNLGLRKARGKYVGIVETDDYILPEMCEHLYVQASTNDLDYIKADGAMFVEADGRELLIDHFYSLRDLGIYGQIIDTRDYPELLLRDGHLWRGLYRLAFLQANNVALQETPGAAYQDNDFLHQTICRGRRVMYVEGSYYRYRRDNAGSSDYQPEGLAYMLNEYDYIERIMTWEEVVPFRQAYYEKMLMMLVNHAPKFPSDTEKAGAILKRWQEKIQAGLKAGCYDQAKNVELALRSRMILTDSKGCIEAIRLRECALREELRLFLTSLDGKEIVLVSAGEKAQCIHLMLLRRDKSNVLAMTDNDSAKQGQKQNGCVIFSVKEAVRQFPQAVFVIANLKYTDSLCEQLMRLGVSQKMITCLRLPLSPHIATGFEF